MVTCPRCSSDSPDDSLHCVHCGLKLGESENQSTQMGMPVQRPGAPSTRQFGVEEFAAALAQKQAEEEGEEDDGPKPQSLLAGLPRPRVSSAPSPLTEGIKKPSRPKQEKPSARSTVMGMPLYGARPSPRVSKVSLPGADEAPEATPTPSTADGPSIQSLDAFGDEIAGGGTAERAEAAMPTQSAPAPQPDARSAAPERGAETDALSEESTEPDPQPPAAAPSARANHRPAAAPAVVAARPSAPSDGAGLSRAFAAIVGLSLLGLVVWPLNRKWFWDALGDYTGNGQLFFVGAGGAGLLALLAAFAPLPSGARTGLALLLAALGGGCLAALHLA